MRVIVSQQTIFYSLGIWRGDNCANSHRKGNNRKYSKKSTNADQKSLETVFSIAICHSVSNFLGPCSSIYFNVFNCNLSGVEISKESDELSRFFSRIKK